MAKWEVSKMWHDHRAALKKHTDEKGRHTPAKSKAAIIARGQKNSERRSATRKLNKAFKRSPAFIQPLKG